MLVSLHDDMPEPRECCTLQVLVPGAYRSVCVELELHHLTVNSIIQVSDGLKSYRNPEHNAQDSRLLVGCLRRDGGCLV